MDKRLGFSGSGRENKYSNEYLGGFMFAFYVMVAIGTFVDLIEDFGDENSKPSAAEFFLVLILGALWPVFWASSITHKLRTEHSNDT